MNIYFPASFPNVDLRGMCFICSSLRASYWNWVVTFF